MNNEPLFATLSYDAPTFNSLNTVLFMLMWYVVFIEEHRCTPRQLSIESVDEQEQLEQRMLQILSKSSRLEMEEELQKLRIELSAKGNSPCARKAFSN